MVTTRGSEANGQYTFGRIKTRTLVFRPVQFRTFIFNSIPGARSDRDVVPTRKFVTTSGDDDYVVWKFSYWDASGPWLDIGSTYKRPQAAWWRSTFLKRLAGCRVSGESAFANIRSFWHVPTRKTRPQTRKSRPSWRSLGALMHRNDNCEWSSVAWLVTKLRGITPPRYATSRFRRPGYLPLYKKYRVSCKKLVSDICTH